MVYIHHINQVINRIKSRHNISNNLSEGLGINFQRFKIISIFLNDILYSFIFKETIRWPR